MFLYDQILYLLVIQRRDIIHNIQVLRLLTGDKAKKCRMDRIVENSCFICCILTLTPKFSTWDSEHIVQMAT